MKTEPEMHVRIKISDGDLTSSQIMTESLFRHWMEKRDIWKDYVKCGLSISFSKVKKSPLLKRAKELTIVILLLCSYTTKAQNIYEDKTNYVVMGFHAGYDFKISSPIAGLQVGYKLGNVFTSLNTLIPVTSNALSPKMFVGTLGYNIDNWQIFGSYGYHTIGNEKEAYFGYSNAWHGGFGLSYYFRQLPIVLTAQKTGKEIISSLTLYKAL